MENINRKIIKKYWGLFLAIALSFFSFKPLLNSGYFPIHDNLQIERVYEMSQALRDHHFPVRWVKDLGYGYGYPLFNFYAPLPYYFGALLHLAGINLITAVKLIFSFGIILATLSMYFLAKEFWEEEGAIFSAILYQYLPYHAVQIYVRGAVGEYWAYGLTPLLALALYKILQGKNRYCWVIFGAITYGALLLSHNVSALLITGILIIFIPIYCSFLIFYKKPKTFILSTISIFILGLGITAFFWLPAFIEKDLTKVNEVITGGSFYADHFVSLKQLWDSPWGYGGSAPPGKIDGMSFKIGKLHLLLGFFSLILIILKRDRKSFYLLLITSSLFLLSIIMMIPVSKPLWQIFRILNYLQFPWRWLILTGFSLSLLGGAVIFFAKRYSSLLGRLIIGLMTFLTITNLHQLPHKIEVAYFKPSDSYQTKASDFINKNNLYWEASKRSDEYLPKNFKRPSSSKDILKTRIAGNIGGGINLLEDKTTRLSFEIQSEVNKEIPVNIAYFPNWRVYLDNQLINVKIKERGFSIIIPSGKHQVMVRFEDTIIRKLANAISFATILLIIIKVKYCLAKK